MIISYVFKIVANPYGSIIASGYSGFDAVDGSGAMKTHVLSNLPAAKSGYLIIYTSNEASNIDVYFDNLRVTHTRGPILEETHYYPFGLTMRGISYKAVGEVESKKKFQGQELAHNEFSDGSGLELYEFKWRMDDPQTGRFWQIDPLAEKYEYNSTYAFSENKVTSHVELEGLEAASIIVSGSGGEVSANDIAKGYNQGLDKGMPVVAIAWTSFLGFQAPTIVAPIIASYVFGAPSPTAPYSAVGSLTAEASTVAGTVTNQAKGSLTIAQNAAKGQEFEKIVVSNLAKEGHTNIAEQVTIKAGNGVKTRVDAVSTNTTGQLALTEAKSSSTAPLTGNQKTAFPSIAQSGGVVVGNGKLSYPGGTVIPPTQVNIVRPAVDNTYVKPVIPIIPLQRNN